MRFDTLTPPDAQPIFSFANGEKGLLSNYIIRILFLPEKESNDADYFLFYYQREVSIL